MMIDACRSHMNAIAQELIIITLFMMFCSILATLNELPTAVSSSSNHFRINFDANRSSSVYFPLNLAAIKIHLSRSPLIDTGVLMSAFACGKSSIIYHKYAFMTPMLMSDNHLHQREPINLLHFSVVVCG